MPPDTKNKLNTYKSGFKEFQVSKDGIITPTAWLQHNVLKMLWCTLFLRQGLLTERVAQGSVFTKPVKRM